jgi:uncharacterized protein
MSATNDPPKIEPATPTQTLPPGEPLAGNRQRLPALDLIRGIAILAILPANIPFFAKPAPFWDTTQTSAKLAGADRVAVELTHLFIDGKFITLLSIVFGLGLAIQVERARAANKPFVGYYLRRMGILLLIGLIYGLLFWWGDILTSYAFVGTMALFVSKLGPRGLKRTMTACFVWAYAVLLIGVALMLYFGEDAFAPPPPAAVEAGVPAAEDSAEMPLWLREHFSSEGQQRIYAHGSFGEMVLNRLLFLVFWIGMFWFVVAWYLLGCFLIGISLLRKGVFHDPARHRPLLVRLALLGGGVGGALQLAGVLADVYQPDGPLFMLFNFGGALLLALGYLGVFTLWSQTGKAEWLQRRFRAVGRMALTNYLLQTLICTTLFYGYGFGLFGSVGRAWLLVFVVLPIWLLQLALSPVWLRYFESGPVEWLWRSLAEGRLRPLLRRQELSPVPQS